MHNLIILTGLNLCSYSISLQKDVSLQRWYQIMGKHNYLQANLAGISCQLCKIKQLVLYLGKWPPKPLTPGKVFCIKYKVPAADQVTDPIRMWVFILITSLSLLHHWASLSWLIRNVVCMTQSWVRLLMTIFYQQPTFPTCAIKANTWERSC